MWRRGLDEEDCAEDAAEDAGGNERNRTRREMLRRLR